MSAPTIRRVTPTAVRVLGADADERTWLDARRQGIGSSDVAAILGVADRRTALHVWYDKRGQLADDDAGEAALWGKLHEDTVSREWARRNRTTVQRVGLVARLMDEDLSEPGWMMCTLDRRVGTCPLERGPGPTRPGCALEVKTRSAFKAGQWRREVPDDVMAQVVWQMAVTGYDHIHVATLLGGNDYRQYVVRYDAALETDIVTAVSAFWHGCVLGGRRPDVDLAAHADDLVDLDNRLHPNRAGSRLLGNLETLERIETIREYEVARLDEKAAKARKDAAKAALIQALDGAAIAATTEHDRPLYTYLPATRSSIDARALAERWPDAYADCVTETTSPRLDIARDLRLTEEDLRVEHSRG